jgi:heparan-sulfate lyase
MSNRQLTGNLIYVIGNPYITPQTFELTGRPLDPSELFDVLDLMRPELADVRAHVAARNRTAAAQALLDYYRSRTGVAWPAWPAQDSIVQDAHTTPALLQANETDFTAAGNAIRHVFQPYAAFPPTDYGPLIDWDWDPHHNIEWPAHMHRMSGWDLATARCYSASGDERYARSWVDLTADWIRRNPITRERCFFPQSWDAIQVGIRATRWSGLLPYFVHSPACTPDFLALLLTALYNHARRMLVLPYPRKGNFGIIEAAGFADIALAFPEFADADAWRAAAFATLDRSMREQVLPDGMHGELSPGYHVHCANLFLGVADTALRNGYGVPFTAGVERMAGVVFGTATPQRCLPVVGDTSLYDTRPFMQHAARAFNRTDFLAAATDGAAGAWPAHLNYAFKDGGYYAFRSDWSPEATWLCLHCGPGSIHPNAFHAQFDNGTFELMSRGRYLMRDPGVYCYARDDPRREAFRRTAAHQTLTLNGENSVRAGRLVRWVEDDGSGNAVLVVENDSYPGLTHRRTVFFAARRYFVLVDEALGPAQGSLDLHFQLAPGPCEIDPASRTARTAFPDGANVLVWADAHAPVTLETEEAWFSPVHNQKEPMPAFRYRHRATGAPARFLTVLAPWSDGPAPQVEARIVSGDIGGESLEIALTVDGFSCTLTR